MWKVMARSDENKVTAPDQWDEQLTWLRGQRCPTWQDRNGQYAGEAIKSRSRGKDRAQVTTFKNQTRKNMTPEKHILLFSYQLNVYKLRK